MAEAVEVVRSKRQPDGRWLLDRIHPGRVHFDLEDGVGSAEPLEHPPRAPGARLVGPRAGGDVTPRRPVIVRLTTPAPYTGASHQTQMDQLTGFGRCTASDRTCVTSP